MKKIFAFSVFLFIFLSPISTIHAETVDSTEPTVYLFGREDCGFCKKEFKYLYDEDIKYEYLNIVSDEHAKDLYNQIAAKHGISKVTPVTIIGGAVLVGFNGDKTTGASIKQAIEKARSSDIKTVEDHIARAPKQDVEIGDGCTGLECEGGQTEFIFDLPVLGVVDLQTFSLFSLSAILGVIDGFNPCAVWVLVTFLVILSQAGSKMKMIFLAGVFIMAKAIMYTLILTVWYKTSDFGALERYVTLLVGFLSVGGAGFFLWCWHKNKKATLIGGITSLDTQMKTINRFREIVNQPITIVLIGVILLIAFSVNVIEFACSVGIPQIYTKILGLNMLSLLERQWYILVYIAGYMLDDFVVFGLVIWGYSKLQVLGGKYTRRSLLFGGIVMLILGLILVINPTLLIL